MALDRKSIVGYFREGDPEFYEHYTDAEIFRGALLRHPELVEQFKFEPEGVSLFKYQGGAGEGIFSGAFDTGQVLSHTERAARFVPQVLDQIDVGWAGIIKNDPELANEKRLYYDAVNEHILKNNPRLQADLYWKQTQPGWTNLDTMVRSFSEAAPSLAASIVGMIAGTGVSAAAGSVAGVPGMVAAGAGWLTAMSPILLMETGSHYTESLGTFIDEYGMTPEEAQDYAQVSSLAYGGISSLLEVVGAKHFMKVGNSILKGIGRESLEEVGDQILTKGLMRKMVDYGVDRGAIMRGTTRLGAGTTAMLSLGMTEGLTEGMQSLTGLTIQRAQELGVEGDAPGILDRLQEAFVESVKSGDYAEEAFAGFTTGILGLGGGAIRGTASQKRFDAIQESLKKSELELMADDDGFDIPEDESPASSQLFSSFLDSIIDPKKGGDAQALAEEANNKLGKRIQSSVEIADAGVKILEVVTGNKDLIEQISEHSDSDSLFESVRMAFNVGLTENNKIEEGDTSRIIKELENYADFGKIGTPSVRSGETFAADEQTPVHEIQWDRNETPTREDEAPPPSGTQSTQSTQGDETPNKRETTPDVRGATPNANQANEIDLLKAARDKLKEEHNKISSKTVKGKKKRTALGVQIYGIEQNIKKLEKGESIDSETSVSTPQETDESSTIQKDDAVVIGGNSKHTNKTGVVVGENKEGIKKPYYLVKLDGEKKPIRIAKSSVSKQVVEDVPVVPETTTPEVVSPESDIVVHSGGALNSDKGNERASADLVWEDKLKEKGVTTKSHSFERHKQGGENKVVHSKDELKAADEHVDKANETLKRKGAGWIDKTSNKGKYVRDLFRRNWYQVKDASQVLAVGNIGRNGKVEGGTAIAVQMAIDNDKPVFVYDQNTLLWKTWDANQNKFVETDTPTIKQGSATIGTRNITPTGTAAIESVINKTFGDTAPVTSTAAPSVETPQVNKEADITKLENEYFELQKRRKEIAAGPKPNLKPIDRAIAKVKAKLDEASSGNFVDPESGKNILDDSTDIPPFSKDLGLTKKQYKAITESIEFATETEREQLEKKDFSGAETSREQINTLRAKLGLEKIEGTPTQQQTESTDHNTLNEYVSSLSPLEQKEYEENPLAFLEGEIDKGGKDVIPTLKALSAYKSLNNLETQATESDVDPRENQANDEDPRNQGGDAATTAAILKKMGGGQSTVEKMKAEEEQKRIETETLKIDKELEDHAKKRGFSDWVQVLTENGYTATAEKFNSLTKREITEAAKRSEDALKGQEDAKKAPDEDTQKDIDKTQKDLDNPKGFDEEQNLFQEEGQSSEILASDDKVLRDKILKKLKKHFPFVDIKTFNGLINVHGIDIIGFATERVVAWSTTDARLDTLPHEFAHIYVKMLKNENIIKLGIEKYGTEEKLVQAIGEYYTNRMRTKGAKNKIKIWLKQFINRLRRVFGVEPKNEKDVMEFIAEEFFQGRWLGINVEVGGGWIDYQSKTIDDIADLGHAIEEASGADGQNGEETDSNLRKYQSDLKITDMYSNILGIYLNKKEHYPKIIDLAEKSDSFEQFRDNLFNWGKNLAEKRGREGDNKIKNKENMTKEEKNKLHLDWLKANRRIGNWISGQKETFGDDKRIYQHLIYEGQSQLLETRGPVDLAQDKLHATTSTRNFVEQDIRDGNHKQRPILLPIKQILKKIKKKDGSFFYKPANHDLTTARLDEMQSDHRNSFGATLKRRVQEIKQIAMDKIDEGVDAATVKHELVESLIALGGDNISANLLSLIGSKLGDKSALISTVVRETPMTLTPKSFRKILDNALNNKLIKDKHYNIMIRDSNLEGMEKMDRDIINLPWSQYILNQAKSDISINDLLNQIMETDLALLVDAKGKMAQSLAQLRFWQEVRTPDYFMYENSAADSMVRLSIDLAEGITPKDSGTGKLMIIDKTATVRNTKNSQDDSKYEYDLFDGATFTGSNYLNRIAKSIGAPNGKISQLKTFIRQREYNEETGDTDYLGMKHMMFAAYEGMVIEDSDGNEIAKLVKDGKGTSWQSAETGELFDMIASPNEAKMTFGGFASTQQKIDAFGDGDYENGYYKIHEINENSVAITQISNRSKTSAAHPIAFAEFLLDMGFDSDEVKNLLSEIRGRYIHVVNHYTDVIKGFHENPALLKEYITKKRDENEVPDELDERIDLINKNGDGIFHKSLYDHILPVLNSRIIQDGINKARSYKNDSSILYLKPIANLPLKEMEDATGHKGLMSSAQNSTVFNHILGLALKAQNLSLDKGQAPSDFQVMIDGEMRYWNKRVSDDDVILNTGLSFGKRIDYLNQYLAENEVWTLVHRNPLQKVTAPVLRRLHKLEKGSHGETFMMSSEDVKDILDGDWDGDKGAIEFISDTHIAAMEKWHESDAHSEASKVLKLEFFGERTDRDEDISDTSALSRKDTEDAVSRNAMSDGSTGIMVNAMQISRQLFHKNFEIATKLGYKLKITKFNQDSSKGVVMDYLPLSTKMLNQNNGDLIQVLFNNGDLIVDKDGKEVEINQADLGEGVGGEAQGALSVASDSEIYLKTTKANELSLLFQMAVDGSKYKFWSDIINNSDSTPFEFAISKIFVRSDGKPLSDEDLATVTIAYGIQNVSQMRGGRTGTGLAATYGIALSQSDSLLNRIMKKMGTDESLMTPNKKGVVKGTHTNVQYSKNFRIEMGNKIASYGDGFKGLDEFDVTMENNITPVESMLMSTAHKIKESQAYRNVSNEILRKEAHVYAQQALMKSAYGSDLYAEFLSGKFQDDFRIAEDFISKKMEIPDAGTSALSNTIGLYSKPGTTTISFDQIWNILKKSTQNQKAVQVDTNEAYAGFIDKFIDKWESLTPESQAWVTLRMLAGTENTIYAMELLPLKLQSKEVMKRYYAHYGQAFESGDTKKRIEAAGGVENLDLIPPNIMQEKMLKEGNFKAMQNKIFIKHTEQEKKSKLCR